MEILEYDGLGLWRPLDLAPKLEAFAGLALLGIGARWLLRTPGGPPDFETVRHSLFDDETPLFVTKKVTCACGNIADPPITVIAHPHEAHYVDAGDFYTTRACDARCQDTLPEEPHAA